MTHSTQSVDARVWHEATAEGDRAVLSVVRDVILETDESLAVQTVLATDMPRLVQALRDDGAPSREVADGYVLRIPDRRGEFLVGLAPVSDGVWHVASFVPATDARWNVVRAIGSRPRSRLAPIYLNEDDFLRIGDRLAEFGELTVSRLTARKPDGSSLSRGWPQDAFPGPSLRDVIDEAQGCSVRTLLLGVPGVLRVHLRRNGGATFYSGDFDVFSDVVLGALSRAGSERFALLSHRFREVGKPSRRPLAVRFDARRLRDTSLIGSLTDAIQHHQPFGVAVFHGNPYVHLVVTDYVDGSNFNVFVADEDEVRIVPGFRATVPSLARLTDLIGDRLGGETIAEARDLPHATLDDLFVRQ